MADDKKKSKIDLKARLKSTTMVGMNVPAVPPPVTGPSAGGSAPPPPLPANSSSPPGGAPTAGGSVRPPPAGISPGIPLPPFATQQRQAPQAAPKPTAAQQTIKVEVGEEVERERKNATKRAAVYASIAAVVGGVMGFVAGGSSEKGGRLKDAARGAALLEKDVKAAGEKMRVLSEKLNEAATKFGSKQFPEEFAGELGGINVPFDTTNLEGKRVGDLPRNTLRNLLAFTSAVDDLNKSKDSLKNILGAAQAPITTLWKEEKDPVAKFSVLFRNDGPNKTVAELVPNKEPFSWKAAEFPANYSVMKLENNKPAEKKATRWTKGDLVGTDPIAVPVDPKTMAGFSNEVLVQRLQKAIYDMRQALEGNKDDPTQETAGLLKQSDNLAQELHKASLNQ